LFSDDILYCNKDDVRWSFNLGWITLSRFLPFLSIDRYFPREITQEGIIFHKKIAVKQNHPWFKNNENYVISSYRLGSLYIIFSVWDFAITFSNNIDYVCLLIVRWKWHKFSVIKWNRSKLEKAERKEGV